MNNPERNQTRRNIIRAGALLVSAVVANVATIKASVASQNGTPGQGGHGQNGTPGQGGHGQNGGH
jgi:hypothetical protein